MNNEISIKKIYLFDKTTYKSVIKKERNKRIIWATISFLIMVFSVFFVVYSIRHNLNDLAVLGLIFIVLSIVFFFVFFYNILMLAGVFWGLEPIFSSRAYAITNNDEIITLKYEIDSYYYRYDVLKDNLLDDIVKLLAFQLSLSKETKEMGKEIEENTMVLNNLYECLNIINVYNVEEKEDKIEIVCDYIDLIKNTSCKKEKLTIFKYYENWEELLDSLKRKKDKPKKEINMQDGKHRNFVDFVIRSSENKNNAIALWITLIIVIRFITDVYAFAIGLEFYIVLLVSIIYMKKRALKYLYDDIEKELLLRKMKIQTVALAIFLIVLIIHAFMHKEVISTLLIASGIWLIILLTMKKKIEK